MKVVEKAHVGFELINLSGVVVKPYSNLGFGFLWLIRKVISDMEQPKCPPMIEFFFKKQKTGVPCEDAGLMMDEECRQDANTP